MDPSLVQLIKDLVQLALQVVTLIMAFRIHKNTNGAPPDDMSSHGG